MTTDFYVGIGQIRRSPLGRQSEPHLQIECETQASIEPAYRGIGTRSDDYGLTRNEVPVCQEASDEFRSGDERITVGEGMR